MIAGDYVWAPKNARGPNNGEWVCGIVQRVKKTDADICIPVTKGGIRRIAMTVRKIDSLMARNPDLKGLDHPVKVQKEIENLCGGDTYK